MGGALTRIVAIMAKEAAHILRDPRVMVFGLVLPVVLLLLFGYAISFDVEHIPIVVVDQDGSTDSRALIDAFAAGESFDVVAHSETASGAMELFQRDVARAALVVPPDYGQRLERGRDPAVQLLLDGADNNTATVSLGYANAIAFELSRESLAALPGQSRVEAPIAARVRAFHNPGLDSSSFIVPGLTAVILAMIATMLTALTVSREIEMGSMEQLFTTPVSRLEIVLGKLSPYFLLALVAVLLVVTVGVWLFDVPVEGSLTLLFGVSGLFILAMLVQGLLISVLTRSQALASQLAVMTTMLPALLLSGFVFPIRNMPEPLQWLAYTLPPSYYIHALRNVLLRGLGAGAVARDSIAITIFFTVLLILTVRKFRRTVD